MLIGCISGSERFKITSETKTTYFIFLPTGKKKITWNIKRLKGGKSKHTPVTTNFLETRVRATSLNLHLLLPFPSFPLSLHPFSAPLFAHFFFFSSFFSPPLPVSQNRSTTTHIQAACKCGHLRRLTSLFRERFRVKISGSLMVDVFKRFPDCCWPVPAS